MSALAQHKRHLGALRDIRDIMAALKNISLTEEQRLRRFLDSQQRMVAGIEQAMGDFLAHYPQELPGRDSDVEIILLIGSERGFCGDFNEALLRQLDGIAPSQRLVIAVGAKLGGKLAEDRISAECLAGPATVEDVPSVLFSVVDKLRELAAQHHPAQLSVVHHHYDGRGIELRRSRPFRDFSPAAERRAYPPLLNVPPEAFFQELLEHYLFAVLHGIFYSSLAAEHQRRLQHLQGAIEHLDRQGEALTRRYNRLRQELITEEIEIIVLSSEAQMEQ
jgi:F-type H+-transporting ATPase subunit gamma